MDQLSAMRTFIRVVETGSFTRAADNLTMPKATVSNMIKNLENHLHTKLVNRSTRHVSVTLDGALYYEQALDIVSRLDELDHSLNRSNASPAGRLRLEMAGTFAAALIVPALQEFYDAYPDLQIDLGVSAGEIDYVGDNIDCAIVVGMPENSSLVARRVGDLSFMTCAAPSYIQKYGHPKHPNDIKGGHRAVGHFRANSQQLTPFRFTRDGLSIDIEPEYVLTVNDRRTFIEAVVAGLGLGQTPLFTAKQAILHGDLVQVLPEWEREGVPIFVVYPQNRHLANKVRVFVDWLVKLLKAVKLNDL
jgi:DNA-binding transcriptional LysR family regulator